MTKSENDVKGRLVYNEKSNIAPIPGTRGTQQKISNSSEIVSCSQYNIMCKLFARLDENGSQKCVRYTTLHIHAFNMKHAVTGLSQ